MNRRVVAAVVFLFVVVPSLVLVGGLYSELVLSDSSDASDATGVADAETLTPPSESQYYFYIEDVEECGTICRDVTVRLENRDSDPVENVRVETVVYADGDEMWRGNETVERIGAGETYTATRRVNIDVWDALRIKTNEGYVTIVTVIRSDDSTTRFERRRKVADGWGPSYPEETTTQSRSVPQSGHVSSTNVTVASHSGQNSR